MSDDTVTRELQVRLDESRAAVERAQAKQLALARMAEHLERENAILRTTVDGLAMRLAARTMGSTPLGNDGETDA